MLQDNDHTVLSKKKLYAIKRIELILYTSAPSFQTYSDLTTLKKRMQKAILHSMGLCRALWRNECKKPSFTALHFAMPSLLFGTEKVQYGKYTHHPSSFQMAGWWHFLLGFSFLFWNRRNSETRCEWQWCQQCQCQRHTICTNNFETSSRRWIRMKTLLLNGFTIKWYYHLMKILYFLIKHST